VDDAKYHKLGPALVDLMQKTAVAPGTLTSASPLAEAGLVAAFADSLRNVGAFDAMLPSMIRVPLKTRVAITTVGATGFVVGEGQAKPISKLTLEDGELTPRKAVAIVVVSDELARSTSSNALSLFGRELRAAVASATDAEFLSVLTTGITPVGTSGGTAAGARQDIRTLLEAVSAGAGSALFLLTTPTIAKALSIISDPNGSGAFPLATWNGGSIAGIPVVVSDSVTAGQLILVDASGVAAASLDFELEDARHVTLDLNDAPDSPPTASTVGTSLWQQNLVALRCTRYFGVERLRTSAVAIIENVAFTGNSPA
jgi:HK97 family phage major capsid protein